MLKIKSNRNEFTIIFLRRLERKRMLKRSRSASVQFSTPSSLLLLFFLFQRLFSFFCFCFQRPSFLFFLLLFSAPLFVSSMRLLFFLFLPAFLFFLVHVCPFFQPKNILFSPNVFQFFSPNVFASVQPLFSSSSFLLYSFLVQPSF